LIDPKHSAANHIAISRRANDARNPLVGLGEVHVGLALFGLARTPPGDRTDRTCDQSWYSARLAGDNAYQYVDRREHLRKIRIDSVSLGEPRTCEVRHPDLVVVVLPDEDLEREI
jgi:hypothetical protein